MPTLNTSSSLARPLHIPLHAVKLALDTAKLRRYNQGRTALLAAYTPSPVVNVDCHRGTTPSAATLAHAKRAGMRVEQAALMERGHIHKVIQRTRNLHGLDEVRKTFGAGMRELEREQRFFLHGGRV